MAKRKALSNDERPTKEQTAKFDRELSKKKQDGALNPLKVKMINRLLRQIKEILGSDPSIEFLDLLDEETLPQNSDAVLILGQFDAAMKQFKEKHHGWDGSEHTWFTKDDGKSRLM
jgi:hypothetical protein